MSNAYMSKICSIHHIATAPLPSSGDLVLRLFRSFSSCTSLVVAHSSPFISHFSLVLTYQISPSDTTRCSEKWFALRKDRLSTGAFITSLGFWKGTHRADLWSEKIFNSESQCLEASKRTMEWGVLKEAFAVERYKSITGHDISFIGFAIHPEQKLDWLSASPDGLLSCSPENGILEVKCPFNEGKPEVPNWPCFGQLCRSTTFPKSMDKWRSWIESGWICNVGHLMGARYFELAKNGYIGISYMEFCMSFGGEMLFLPEKPY